MWRAFSMATLAVIITACGTAPADEAAPDRSVAAVLSAPGAHQLPLADITSAIAAGVAATPAAAAEADDLAALYTSTGQMPLWLDGRGHPSQQAVAAMALLADAGTDGLAPADYGVDALDAQARTLREGAGDAEGLARFDVDLSRGILRFLRHLHVGRIDPRTIGFRLDVPPDDHGFAAVVASAVADDRLAEAVVELRPALWLYEPLRMALADYRVRAGREAASEGFPALPRPVKPGEAYAGTAQVGRRLLALGDLAADAVPSTEAAVYDGPVVEAVRRFQVRHGLEPDGVLGAGTLTALAVPLRWRVRQIELALERLRWLPHLAQGRVVVVNIPMFHLWAWDRLSIVDRPAFDTDIIVGRALDTETPVFMEDMRYVVFRPYWNVPPSILRGEVLPRLVRDPGYLARERMEIVWGQGDNATPAELNAENLALLRTGALRVRQRPGTHNALGLVKFMFPNQDNVYLHGTPAQSLFSRARRDFSHGCVRVADPAGLAAWVLEEQPEWTAAAIDAAMTRGADSRVVNLARPVQVILTYVTAVVWPGEGTVRFAPDIYEHDHRLDDALAAGR